MNMGKEDIKKTVGNLLCAPYPLEKSQFKTIFEKCVDFYCVKERLYKCNVCKIKLLGDSELLKHNKCFKHQTELEKVIMDMLQNPTVDR